MADDIILLTDYKGYFGSKQKSEVYRGGVDIRTLKSYFGDFGLTLVPMQYSEIDLKRNEFGGKYVLYTSEEDPDRLYKGYIEDLILALELGGAKVIPEFKYLRAHENKVFMELLRDLSPCEPLRKLESRKFGCIEELQSGLTGLDYPSVVKSATGAMSKGVFIASDAAHLGKVAKKVSRSRNRMYEFKDGLRSLKHKGYKKDSLHRNKFIVQDFVPDLKNDWKVLIFWDKIYILYRGVRDNDFRASGSMKFVFDDDELNVKGIFEFCETVFRSFRVPYASIDVMYDGQQFYVAEFQFVNFGTTTMEKSRTHFHKVGSTWTRTDQTFTLEYLMAYSVSNFISHYRI